MTMPVLVSRLWSAARATPKSMRESPFPVSITLDGLRSRCTMSAPCTTRSPVAAPRKSRHRAPPDSGPPLSRIASSRVMPGMNSVANHGGFDVRSLASSLVSAPPGSRARLSSSCPKWLRKSASSARIGSTRFTAANFPGTAPR